MSEKKNANQSTGIDRREWITSAAALAAGAAAAPFVSNSVQARIRPRPRSRRRHAPSSRQAPATSSRSTAERFAGSRGTASSRSKAFPTPRPRPERRATWRPRNPRRGPAFGAAWRSVRVSPALSRARRPARRMDARRRSVHVRVGRRAARRGLPARQRVDARPRPTRRSGRCSSGFTAAAIRQVRRTSCGCMTARASRVAATWSSSA